MHTAYRKKTQQQKSARKRIKTQPFTAVWIMGEHCGRSLPIWVELRGSVHLFSAVFRQRLPRQTAEAYYVPCAQSPEGGGRRSPLVEVKDRPSFTPVRSSALPPQLSDAPGPRTHRCPRGTLPGRRSRWRVSGQGRPCLRRGSLESQRALEKGCLSQ